jgi:hypothetical protein
LIYLYHHREDGRLSRESGQMRKDSSMGRKVKLTSVHSQTTDGRTDVEPSATTSLTECCKVVMGVGGNTNGSAGFGADSSDFTALQTDCDLLDLLANLFL